VGNTCLVVGGGVIGLSLAYELARRRWQVTVLDQAGIGREASWAGAGILPPANAETALHPLDRLRALSDRLHWEWAPRLLQETGIDTGLRRCGGLYLARTAGEAALLAAMSHTMQEERIVCRRLTLNELIALEPGLEQAAASGQLRAVYELPDECQLRNPRYLQALAAACRLYGVEIVPDCKVTQLHDDGSRLTHLTTEQGIKQADAVVIASGAWTQRLLAQHGIATGVFPMRGQMLLFKCDRPPLRRIVNEGIRYLVPRDDGYLLAGSTEEEAGFDKSNTPTALAELTEFATTLVPALKRARLEKTWAGLRPATFDGFPYLGRLPGLSNAFVASGHYRSGLHMSTGTAHLMAQLLCAETPEIDLTPFRVARG
jgi:glycine oxidase